MQASEETDEIRLTSRCEAAKLKPPQLPPPPLPPDHFEVRAKDRLNLVEPKLGDT